MATIVGGSDIYLMDLSGLTIAANNFGQPDTFVGNNYAFRPYFSEAVQTGDSVAYFALGLLMLGWRNGLSRHLGVQVSLSGTYQTEVWVVV